MKQPTPSPNPPPNPRDAGSEPDPSQAPDVFPWYALQVRVSGEDQVSKNLAALGYEVFCPKYVASRQYSDRIKKIELALFPGYAFCRVDISKRLPILKMSGVRSFVSVAGVPVSIPDHEIRNIQTAVSSGAATKPWPYFNAGQRVRVTCGSLTGVEGHLLTVKGVDQVILSIEILQRSVSVAIDSSWVQPVY